MGLLNKHTYLIEQYPIILIARHSHNEAAGSGREHTRDVLDITAPLLHVTNDDRVAADGATSTLVLLD